MEFLLFFFLAFGFQSDYEVALPGVGYACLSCLATSTCFTRPIFTR